MAVVLLRELVDQLGSLGDERSLHVNLTTGETATRRSPRSPIDWLEAHGIALKNDL